MQFFTDILDKNQKLSDEKAAAKAKAAAEKAAAEKAKAEAAATHLNAWLNNNRDTVLEVMNEAIGEFLELNQLRPAEVSIVEVPEWDLYNRWCQFGGIKLVVEYLDDDGNPYPEMSSRWGREEHKDYFVWESTIKVEDLLRLPNGEYKVIISDLPRSRVSAVSTWENRYAEY